MGVWKKTQCNNCGLSCGLELEIENNKIINIRPDKDSPRTHGYCCRKGRAVKYFQHHGDRIKYPKKKVGDHYEEISWEQAYREIGEKARAIIDKHGPRSFSILGCALGSAQTPCATAKPLLQAVGSQYMFNPIGIEFMGNWWSHGKILGDQMHFLEPDDGNGSEVIIYWGSNSYVSHQIQGAREVCREYSENPDKLVIAVDPRLSETARMADMHIMPAMGTDSLYLRALIALILEKGWEDKAYIAEHVADWDKTKKWFENIDIDGSLRVCKIPREQTEEFAKILTTKKWGMHQDLGLFFGRHNTLNSYLAILLSVVCGMCLMPGGCIVPECVIERGKTIDEHDPKTWRAPVTNTFPVLEVYPVGIIPDEILGDNEDRIRIMFTSMGNPLRSYPDSNMMRKALSSLELLVAIDCQETEVTRMADYVLPGKSLYEGGGDFNAFTLNFPEIVFQSRKPVLLPEGDPREDVQIFAELTQAMGYLPRLPQWLYRAAEKAVLTGDRMSYFMKLVGWTMLGNVKYFGQLASVIAITLGKAMGSSARAISWAGMLTGPIVGKGYIEHCGFKPDLKKHPILGRIPMLKDMCAMDEAFAAVDAHPEGYVIGMNEPETQIKKHIAHKDGKIHTWCEEIDGYIKRITPEKEEEALKLKDGNNFILSAGRHSEDGHNATMRNPATYKFRQPYTLAMNPEDGAEMGFENGETVRVSTKAGELTIPVEYTWQTARGYVLIPHHFGYTFEGKKIGEHVNVLTSHKDIDELTGNPTWRYTPCRVEKL